MRYPNLDNCLFTAVDVQREFCDPLFGERGNDKTDRIAKRIASFSNVMHEAGLPICWIYFDEQLNAKEQERRNLELLKLINKVRFNHAGGGPHYIAPKEGHFMIPKNADSAFMSDPSPFRELLIQQQTKDIIMTGFNYSACVWKTIQDALLEGYNIYLVRDLCGNDNRCYDAADDYIREAYWGFQRSAQERANATTCQNPTQAQKVKQGAKLNRDFSVFKAAFNKLRGIGSQELSEPAPKCCEGLLGELHFIDTCGLAMHVQQWQDSHRGGTLAKASEFSPKAYTAEVKGTTKALRLS